MEGWALIGAALAVNYHNHTHGRPTICSTGRRVLPKPILLPALGVGAGVLIAHVAKGYMKDLQVGFK